ncbi:hypothetical protein D9M68_934750 [compost metagenome]
MGKVTLQLGRISRRARGGQLRLRLSGSGSQLIQIRRADQLFGRQLGSSRVLRLRQDDGGIGLLRRGFGLCERAVQRAMVEFEQDLPLLDLLSHVHIQGGYALAAQFNAQLHFLVGRNRAGHDDTAGQGICSDGSQGHRQCR